MTKKLICALVATVLAAGMLGGCAQEGMDGPAARSRTFTAGNEIYTYEKIDPEKTQLVVSGLGNNADVRKLSRAFEAKNPDIQVICLDLTGGTLDYKPVEEWVKNGVSPDIMFVNPDSFSDEAFITEYLVDLSANPVIENFEAQALNRIAVDGLVYFLPAPSEINCILYNKTLFEQYGWSVPKTFDEFVALCVRIREDTGGAVQPWNPNAKYDKVFTTALEAFAYAQIFGGADNRSWYNDFCSGEATFAGHVEPFFDMIQTLIDNGILLEEHFDYSATTRGKDFEGGLLAMYNAPISRMESDEFDFDYMPYPSTDGETGFVNDYFSAMLCVPKGEHTDAQADAIERYIAFFGSVEGQQALIDDTLMASNVKGVSFSESEATEGIAEVIEQGRVFSRMEFPGPGERTWTFREAALSMTTGEKTGAQVIAEIDANPYKTVQEGDATSVERIAVVDESFTVLEFSMYIADMYRETAQADIGLINHGIAYRGNLIRLFAGDIYESYMNPIKPRSFANGSTLVKVSMTGRQMVDALNNPVGNSGVSESIYAFSGLKCEVAPWNELGSKYVSVKLADGSALDMDKLYTVAIWQGCVADEYITETLETFEGSWEELMAAKMRADGALAPADDGRITLIWE